MLKLTADDVAGKALLVKGVSTGSDALLDALGRTTLQVDPGCSLLLMGVDPKTVNGACEMVAVPMAALVRVVVLADLSAGHEPRMATAGSGPVALIIDARIDDEASLALWLGDQVIRNVDGIQPLIRYMASLESYQLLTHICGGEPDQTIGVMAARYGYSVAHFRRKCKSVLERPLKQELRLLRAARSLQQRAGRRRSQTHVAADNGYASLSHFCTDIKSLVGMSLGALYQAVEPMAESSPSSSSSGRVRQRVST